MANVCQFTRRGGAGGLHGVLNEVNLLMLYLAEGNERVKRGDITGFHLGANVAPAMDFDDIVFKYYKASGSKVIFLQAKHREKVLKPVNPAEMSMDGDYSLRRYLKSYIEAKKNFSRRDFEDLVLKNVNDQAEYLFFTNAPIKEEKNVLQMELQDKHEFLSFFKKRQNIDPKSYKIIFNKDAPIIKELQIPLDLLKLAEELVKAYDKQELYLTSEIFKRYNNFMTNHVVQIEVVKCKFRDAFFDDIDERVVALRKELVKKLLKKNDKEEDLICKLKELVMKTSQKMPKKINNRAGNQVEEPLIAKVALEDIEDFLSRFLLNVNQPGELDLEDMIKEKITNRFKELSISDCQFVYDHVCIKIFAWWRNTDKSQTIKVNYLTEKDDYYNDAKDYLSCRKMTTSIDTELAESKMGTLIFEKTRCIGLLNLIKKCSSIGIAIGSKSVKILHYAKLRQVLSSSKYKSKTYNYYRVDEKCDLDSVIKSFKTFFNTLILELHCKDLLSKGKCEAIEEIISSNEIKKLILVGELSILQNLDLNVNIWNEDITYSHLEKNSQCNLLKNTEIIVQGQKMRLVDVIKKKHCHLIDAETLSKLVCNGESYHIGKPPKCLDECQDYFIERTLHRAFRVNKSCFRDRRLMFIVSGARHGLLEALRLEAGRSAEEIHHIDYSFERLALQIREDCSLHWLRYEDGFYYWVKSTSGLDDMRQHLTTDLEEIESKMMREKFILVAAEPGMGKTTLLTSLAGNQIRSEVLWSIKINLNEHSGKFTQWRDQAVEIDRNVVVDFLAESLQLDSFGRNLLNCYFNELGRMIIFLDGFDEICPSHKQTVVRLIEALGSGKAESIWISTRPYTAKELENSLCVFAHTLKPFTDDDQRKFLKLFWKSSLKLAHLDEIRSAEFIDRLLNYFTRTVDDNIRQFISIPLQLQMFGVSYREHFKMFHSDTRPCDDAIFENSDKSIFDLYEGFVLNKFRVWEEGKLANRIVTEAERIDSVSRFRNFIKEHSEMAFVALFDINQLLELFSVRELQEIKLNVESISRGEEQRGIVNGIFNGKPVFVHRTYAEFLVGKFLANMMPYNTENVRNFLRIIDIFNGENTIIKVFLDLSLSVGKPSHKAVLTNNLRQINETDPETLDSTDSGGRRPLHLTASYGKTNMLKAILHKSILYDSINLPDKLFEWKPISYACHSRHWGAVELLLTNGADREAIEDMVAREEQLLHESAKQGYVEITKIIIAKRPRGYIDEKIKNETAIFTAVSHHQLDMVRLLLSLGANVLNGDIDGNTVLHAYTLQYGTCSMSDSDAMFDLLKPSLGRRGVNVTDDFFRTPLNLAVKGGNYNLVKKLMNSGADTYETCSQSTFNDSLIRATRMNRMDNVVRALEENPELINHFYCGQNPLHIAVRKGRKKIARYLLEKYADITACNSYNWTPLHVASHNGNLYMVKLLEGCGARPTDSKCGWTVLHNAAMGGRINVMKYYLEEYRDSEKWINISDRNGTSLLHTAAFHCQGDMVRLLLQHGADCSLTDVIGTSQAMAALIQYDVDSCKEILIRQKSLPRNEDDADKLLPKLGICELHMAVAHGDLELVRWLVEVHGMHVDAGKADGITPLHTAAIFDQPEVFDYLISMGADRKATVDYYRVKANINSSRWPAMVEDDVVVVVPLIKRSLRWFCMIVRLLDGITPSEVQAWLDKPSSDDDRPSGLWAMIRISLKRKLLHFNPISDYIGNIKNYLESNRRRRKKGKRRPQNITEMPFSPCYLGPPYFPDSYSSFYYPPLIFGDLSVKSIRNRILANGLIFLMDLIILSLMFLFFFTFYFSIY